MQRHHLGIGARGDDRESALDLAPLPAPTLPDPAKRERLTIGTRDRARLLAAFKMQRAPSGQFIVQDVKRVRGGPDEVEALIVNTAQQDGRGVRTAVRTRSAGHSASAEPAAC